MYLKSGRNQLKEKKKREKAYIKVWKNSVIQKKKITQYGNSCEWSMFSCFLFFFFLYFFSFFFENNLSSTRAVCKWFEVFIIFFSLSYGFKGDSIFLPIKTFLKNVPIFDGIFFLLDTGKITKKKIKYVYSFNYLFFLFFWFLYKVE